MLKRTVLFKVVSETGNIPLEIMFKVCIQWVMTEDDNQSRYFGVDK